MRILQLCKKFPFPLRDGESMAIRSLARGLWSHGAELDLLSFNTTKHWVGVDESVLGCLDHYSKVDWVPLDNEVRPVDMFLNLFSSESYNIARYVDDRFRELLIERLMAERYDIVLVESIYMMPYANTVREYSDARLILRSHNVEFEIWERLAVSSPKTLYKWYFEHCAKKLKYYELSQTKKADIVVPITTVDELKFNNAIPGLETVVVPVGMPVCDDDESAAICDSESSRAMGFIGSLDWIPNMEGVTWFLDEVLPLLDGDEKDLEFHVAGRNTPDWIFSRHNNRFKVHGEVDSSMEFICQFPLFIVPLFSGSGVRVKILEAMSAGRVVVTTDVGIEGIEAVAGRHFLLANTAEDFARAIVSAFRDPLLCSEMAAAARIFVRERYDAREIVIPLVHTLMQRKKESSE